VWPSRIASVANSTNSSGGTCCFVSFFRVERRLRFPFPGPRKAGECLCMPSLLGNLGLKCKSNLMIFGLRGHREKPLHSSIKADARGGLSYGLVTFHILTACQLPGIGQIGFKVSRREASGFKFFHSAPLASHYVRDVPLRNWPEVRPITGVPFPRFAPTIHLFSYPIKRSNSRGGSEHVGKQK
jgi:hypothetical protein